MIFVDDDKSLQDAGRSLLASLETSRTKEVKHGDCDTVGPSDDREESLLAQLVGLDTEWRPERFRNKNKTSILQVSRPLFVNLQSINFKTLQVDAECY